MCYLAESSFRLYYLNSKPLSTICKKKVKLTVILKITSSIGYKKGWLSCLFNNTLYMTCGNMGFKLYVPDTY